MRILEQSFSLLVILSILFLAACNNSSTSSSSSDPSSKSTADDNTMFIGLVNPPVSFNPINSSDLSAQWLEKFMFDTFLEMDAPLNFSPKLAESFETIDNQIFTIKINQNANWSDGTPVTANDLAFTFNLISNPKTETSVGSYLTVLEGLDESGKLPEGQTEIPSISVIDDKTFQFKMKQPVDANMVKEQIGTKLMILPEHILKDVAPEDLSTDPFMQNPTVTNGPFKFVQYKKDQYVEYEKNADYYFGDPKLEKLFVKIMPAANLVAQLQTGEIQMNAAAGIGKITVQDYETVKGFEDVTTKTEPTYGYQTMLFNTETITDAKVRQALAYAVDREQIVDSLLKGQGEIIDGPYTSISPYLDKDIEGVTYDPEKAKQLLEEANWDFNKPIKLVVPTGNKVREQSANIIAENLKAIGLNIETTTYDFPSIMAKGQDGDFDLLLIGYTNSLDPDVTRLYASNSSSNFPNYKSEETDELLNAGKNEDDPEKRKGIYSQLQKIWLEDMPSITLYSDYDFAAISNQVENGGPKIFGFHKDLQNWSLVGAQ